MTRRISSLPGRLRVRDLSWRGAPELNERATALQREPGVRQVECNPRTGSLLVRYDPAQADRPALERLLGIGVAEQPPAAPAPVASSTAGRRPRPLRLRVNRAAKIGMLGSLGVSLALVAAGSKKGHALAGGAFLAALATHLTVHRQHILR